MAFEKFTNVGQIYSPKATITKNGTISFNQGTKRRFNTDNFSHAVLYYDKEVALVAAELTNDMNAEGAIKIRTRETGADIAGKSFLNYYDIKYEDTTMYEITNGEDRNWIVIDLKTGRLRNQ